MSLNKKNLKVSTNKPQSSPSQCINDQRRDLSFSLTSQGCESHQDSETQPNRKNKDPFSKKMNKRSKKAIKMSKNSILEENDPSRLFTEGEIIEGLQIRNSFKDQVDFQIFEMFKSYFRVEDIPNEVVVKSKSMLLQQIQKVIAQAVRRHIIMRNKSSLLQAKEVIEVVEKLGEKYKYKILRSLVMCHAEKKVFKNGT